MSVFVCAPRVQCASTKLCDQIDAKIKFSPYVPPDTGAKYKCMPDH